MGLELEKLDHLSAIFLDMDGTLTDLNQRWWKPFERNLKIINSDFEPAEYEDKFASSLPEFLEIASEKSRFVNLRIFWKVTNVLELSLLKKFRLLRLLRNDENAFKEIELLPDAEKLLPKLLESKFKTGIVTTASSETLEIVKSKYSLFNEFDILISRDDVEKVKPDPEGILTACQTLEVEPSNAIYIGDFPHDIEAAKNAGLVSVGVYGSNKKYTEQLLKKANPDYLVDSIGEILSSILEQNEQNNK